MSEHANTQSAGGMRKSAKTGPLQGCYYHLDGDVPQRSGLPHRRHWLRDVFDVGLRDSATDSERVRQQASRCVNMRWTRETHAAIERATLNQQCQAAHSPVIVSPRPGSKQPWVTYSGWPRRFPKPLSVLDTRVFYSNRIRWVLGHVHVLHKLVVAG